MPSVEIKQKNLPLCIPFPHARERRKGQEDIIANKNSGSLERSVFKKVISPDHSRSCLLLLLLIGGSHYI